MILLVVGGSSDIGMSLIERIHSEYECVVCQYRTENSHLMELKESLGDKLLLFKADLMEINSVKGMIHEIKGLGLTPDHIVHFPSAPFVMRRFAKTEWSSFQESLDVSLRSAVMVLQAFLPDMAKNHYGRTIIMLSSVVCNNVPAYYTDYVVAKYALLGLVRSLATEYADKGITINGVSPMMVQTKFIENQPDLVKEQNALDNPIGRLLRIDEVVPTIEYLLSEGVASVNGQNILISCGR